MPLNKRGIAIIVIAGFALAACGKQEPAAPEQKPAAAAPAPSQTADASAQTADLDRGKSVYTKTCAMCHAAAVAGAPKPGDKADWGPRIAQGEATLHKHALEGYTGAKGQMPARGGAVTLSDDEVKAAVNYMVAQSR